MSKKPTTSSSTSSSSNRIKDARFASFESNPRFKLPSKNRSKTTIDKRFARMLKDDDFIAGAKVDRYGRRLKSDSKKRALKRMYREEGEDEDEDEDEDKDEDKDEKNAKDKRRVEVEVDDDDVVRRELEKADAKYDPARGGGFSSSESDSDSDEEEDNEPEDDEAAESAQAGAKSSMQRLRDAQAEVETGEVTRRIAIVNLDWDHIKSADLMALFSSFAPKGGSIERVSIYPSEFGKERMQREELEGPPKEIFKKAGGDKSQDDEDGEEESGFDSEDEEQGDEDEEENDEEKIRKEIIEEGDDEDFDSDALRAYQLDRLRYYYAVMVCSDAATAQKIYEATDGTEYQSSSNFIDLRFVPDDVTFDNEPRDECDRVAAGYKPTEFTTDALQHSKVRLTWDMHPEEVARKEDIKRVFTGSRSELEENDMRAYLASDSEDDEDVDADVPDEGAGEPQPKLSKKELKAQKMRELLGLGSEPLAKSSKSATAPVGDMQITFTPALMGGDEGGKQKRKNGKEEEEEEGETTLEKYKRKERERKAKKKEKVLARRQRVDPDTAAGTDSDRDGDGNGAGDGEEDLGFDDPFFTTAAADERGAAGKKASKTAERKEERRRRREAREAEAAENAAQRAQLEGLMRDDDHDLANNTNKTNNNEGDDDDDDAAAPGRLGHFDMNEIRRAEKARARAQRGKKKGKKNKPLQGGEGEDEDGSGAVGGGGLQTGFRMDVDDARFAGKLFADGEFAIDPSHPQFRATEGMREILAESRRKRRLDEVEVDDEGEPQGREGKKKKKMGKKDKKTRREEEVGEETGAAVGAGAGKNDDLASLVESVRRKAKGKKRQA